MNTNETSFRTLLNFLSADPEAIQVWADPSIQAIRLAQSSMSAFIQEYGDGQGFENSVGAYWTLDLSDDLATLGMPGMAGRFWQFVAFEQLLGCEEEQLIIAGDDSETIWQGVTELFEDSETLELDPAVFENETRLGLELMQNKLNRYAKDNIPYRLLSLVPPFPDGANIYVALVKANNLKSVIELFSHFGVNARDAAEHGSW